MKHESDDDEDRSPEHGGLLPTEVPVDSLDHPAIKKPANLTRPAATAPASAGSVRDQSVLGRTDLLGLDHLRERSLHDVVRSLPASLRFNAPAEVDRVAHAGALSGYRADESGEGIPSTPTTCGSPSRIA